MTPFAILRADHDRVRALIDRFEELGPRSHRDKRMLFDEIRGEIEAHQRLEEEVLYPAAREAGIESAAGESHRIVERLLAELQGLGVGNRRFDVVFAVLRENVEQHIREEERDVLGDLEGKLTTDRRETLRHAIERRHESLHSAAG
ncbi:MAG TPA: hemerythrin domain-containing protein [Thermoanaerobaculia bacterium]|nr:hemerythrin domain-containing protein [Thermoanaerobaculia bacterium]